MIHWLDRLATIAGRKYAYVDFYGDIQMYRYFVFFYEPHEPKGIRSWLPNIFVHHYLGEPGGAAPDGESPHSHPYTTLALLVKGSYTELINETEIRTTRALGTSLIRHTHFHRLVSVVPGTVSIFSHGFRRRRNWTIDRKDGQLQQFRSDIDSGVIDRSIITWIKVDENFNKEVNRRQRAAKKLGLSGLTNAQKIQMKTKGNLS